MRRRGYVETTSCSRMWSTQELLVMSAVWILSEEFGISQPQSLIGTYALIVKLSPDILTYSWRSRNQRTMTSLWLISRTRPSNRECRSNWRMIRQSSTQKSSVPTLRVGSLWSWAVLTWFLSISSSRMLEQEYGHRAVSLKALSIMRASSMHVVYQWMWCQEWPTLSVWEWWCLRQLVSRSLISVYLTMTVNSLVRRDPLKSISRASTYRHDQHTNIRNS